MGTDTNIEEESRGCWTINVDGSSRENASGPGIIIQTPNGLTLHCALQFCFGVSNNEAEYEAILAGLELALELGAEKIEVYSDSQLVVGQMVRGFEVNEDRLKKYKAMTKKLWGPFKMIELIQIPREENGIAGKDVNNG